MSEFDSGNSIVRRNEQGEKKPRELKRFSGVAPIQKKQVNSFFSWVSRMFFSGKTWKEILMDVVEHQVVPELKQGARDALVSMIDMKFDKDYTPGPGSSIKTVSNGSFVTQYVDYAAASTSKATEAEREANKAKDEEIRKSGYEMPSFTREQDAREFLKSMKDEANFYGQITVHDLAWKQGKDIDYTWDAYGWTKEQINAIKRPTRMSPPVVVNGVRYNYVIELPKARPID